MLINYDLTGKSGSYNIGPNSGNYLAKSKGVCREMKSEGAENGGYPPTQTGDIRSLFWLFSLMALQN